MAVAGRILIMPKGAYDENETYEMLDLVNHNGVSWLAKKTCVGIEPSMEASEYWHIMLGIEVGVLHEDVELEQADAFMQVDVKEGYRLTSAVVNTSEMVDSDVIIGICLQNDKYILVTKGAPEAVTNKNVSLVWTKKTE